MYIPNPGRLITRRREDRRPALGVQAALPQGVAGGTNRAIAIWGTTIIDGSSDNQMYAIDARTGKLVWETPVLDPRAPASPSSGPIIANGKIIRAASVSRRRPTTRASSPRTTPRPARRSGARARSRARRAGQRNLGRRAARAALARRHVDGAELRRRAEPVIVGTSVTIPAPKFILGGNDKQHLYHNSTLAIDADTGKIVWYYSTSSITGISIIRSSACSSTRQVAPDRAKSRGSNPRIKPANSGRCHRHPGQDRHRLHARPQDRRVLWARPTVFQNVDHEDRRRHRQGHRQSRGRRSAAIDQERFVCPSSNGGKNWPAGAYNPQRTSCSIRCRTCA
jgi:alcohol dehydrogenase (cytochrome c)